MLLLDLRARQGARTSAGARTRTIGGFAGAGAILLRPSWSTSCASRNPLFPFSIFRIKGLAAADVTQVIAMAGFYSMFFFITLYMQNVLGFSQIQAGRGLSPGHVRGRDLGRHLLTAVRPHRARGRSSSPARCWAPAASIWLSRIPVHGSYLDRPAPRPGDHVVRARRGVRRRPHGRPGRRATGQGGARRSPGQRVVPLGGALGLAIFSAIATSRTSHLLASHVRLPTALTSGFQRALLAAADLPCRRRADCAAGHQHTR